MNNSGSVVNFPLSPFPAIARRELRELLEHRQWPGDVDDVILAVHEALTNSERHAGGARRAAVRLEGSDLVVEVCDAGPGFDLEDHIRHPPHAFAERGRGLWLISRIAQSCAVTRDPDGTRLVLRFVA